MLTIDLVRHGPALPASATGDAGRSLSPDGRSLVRRLAERLEKENWRPLPGYVSPLLRARQTAEILAGVVPGGLPMIVLPELGPDGDPGVLLEVIGPLVEPESHTVVIGHQPMMGDLLTILSGISMSLSAGALVRLEFEDTVGRGRGQIVATMLPPGYR